MTYSNPNVNPFRTLPKDAPLRAPKEGQTSRPQSTNYNNDRSNQSGNFAGNFRGRTPGYNARGGMNNNNNNNMNGNNFNRNFPNPAMNNMGGNFNPPMGGQFSNNAMGGQFGGFNRGGMMGMRGGANMRGGRGGMQNGMMGGMPMGGMPMGGMPGGMGGMPMNMGQMGGGMQGTNNPNSVQVYHRNNLQVGKANPASTGQSLHNTPLTHQYRGSSREPRVYLPPSKAYSQHCYPSHINTQAKTQAAQTGGGGFQGLQPHFNPAFFQQNQAAGGDWQNPHGAKRARPE